MVTPPFRLQKATLNRSQECTQIAKHTVRELAITKGSGQIKRNIIRRERKRTSKDKVGQHGEEKESADDYRTGYLVYIIHLSDSHSLRNKEGLTEVTRITSADHGDTTLVQGIPIHL